MEKKLVIVESPAKAKTINKILGSDYVVMASMGHVRDLPQSQFGVDLEHGFKPKYVLVKGRRKTVEALRKAAASANGVFLAPDPDREGEAIAWHLSQILAKHVEPDKIYRVLYNEITPNAVRTAFENCSEIDRRKVDSQQARRILDRIVGYRVSPLLWQHVKRGLSAGRVQSVALRLVCEREQEIIAFVPQEYWIFGAKARKEVDPRTPFELRLARIDGKKAEIGSGQEAERVRTELEGRTLKVSRVATREIHKRAAPPYITSSLQQAGSSYCGFSPSKTMRIAQRLYEGVDIDDETTGLITYMRTDSFRTAQTAIEACRGFVNTTYGKEFLPEKPNFYKSRAGAQEAHEAIRPTDVTRTPDSVAQSLAPEEQKLYGLIWRRFVASQMAPALIAQRSVDVDASAPDTGARAYLFRGSASEVVFPGYMKVSGIEKKTAPRKNGEEEEPETGALPQLAEGEPLECLEWLSERKETQPPARFSEASLVRRLEEDGVGRPSTYAQVLSTLNQRQYVRREKRVLIPTELGMRVCKFLVDNLADLFDVGFTAEMESLLDEIEKGSIQHTQMLQDFYARFKTWLEGVASTEIESDKALVVLDLLEKVKEWAPEVQRGKRTFSDRKFVDSLRRRISDKDKKLSIRQWRALLQIAQRYQEQVPELHEKLGELDLQDLPAAPAPAAPDETTLRKFALLERVQFEPATVRAGKKRDDKEFVASLKDWVDGGRALSPAQLRALDRLVIKYAGQIEGFEEIRESLNLAKPQAQADPGECGRLLDSVEKVREWGPPVKTKRGEWDDKKFFDSLRRQYAQRGSLTVRQFASLKRLARKYANQIEEDTAAQEPAEK